MAAESVKRSILTSPRIVSVYVASGNGNLAWLIFYWSVETTHAHLHVSPIYTTEKTGSADPLKSHGGPDQLFLTLYTGNNKARLMIEKCNNIHARNHC